MSCVFIIIIAVIITITIIITIIIIIPILIDWLNWGLTALSAQ